MKKNLSSANATGEEMSQLLLDAAGQIRAIGERVRQAMLKTKKSREGDLAER